MRRIKKFAEGEAAKRGLSFAWKNGSSHLLLELTRDGQRRQVVIASSPRSRDNQFDWIRQDIRRIAREI